MSILGIMGINKESTVQSIHENMAEGTAAIIYENETNFSTMMKSIGVNEYVHFQESGQVIVYEAGTLEGFFNKMKGFFEAMKKKVIELFNKFIAKIDSWVRSDEAFIKKHRAKILSRDVNGMKYKGYQFTTNATSSITANNKLDMFLAGKNLTSANAVVKSGAAIKTQDGYSKAWRENNIDNLEEMRATAVGKSGKLSSSDFKTEIDKLFRNGKEEAEEFSPNMADQLAIIAGSKKQKEEAKKSMEDIKKSIDKVISDLKKSEKELTKYDKDDTEDAIKGKAALTRYVSVMTEAQKDKLNMVQRVHGGLLSAISAENRQAKSICVRALGYNKEKSVNESARTSFIDGVQYI